MIPETENLGVARGMARQFFASHPTEQDYAVQRGDKLYRFINRPDRPVLRTIEQVEFPEPQE